MATIGRDHESLENELTMERTMRANSGRPGHELRIIAASTRSRSPTEKEAHNVRIYRDGNGRLPNSSTPCGRLPVRIPGAAPSTLRASSALARFAVHQMLSA